MPKKRTAETTDWGLSKDVLDNLDLFNLTDHILQWHRDNECALVGSFKADFYLCFQNQEPQRVWKCEFSLNEPEPTAQIFEGANYITAKDLIPELDESDRFPLSLQELSIRLRRRLRSHDIKRASAKAREYLKKKKKKKKGKIPDK